MLRLGSVARERCLAVRLTKPIYPVAKLGGGECSPRASVAGSRWAGVFEKPAGLARLMESPGQRHVARKRTRAWSAEKSEAWQRDLTSPGGMGEVEDAVDRASDWAGSVGDDRAWQQPARDGVPLALHDCRRIADDIARGSARWRADQVAGLGVTRQVTTLVPPIRDVRTSDHFARASIPQVWTCPGPPALPHRAFVLRYAAEPVGFAPCARDGGEHSRCWRRS